MSMVIANNMQAVNTKRQFAISGRGQSSAMEKLSSGYKINTGKDDPSGLVISEKLRSQLNGLKRAQQNTEEGINVMGIAEGALNEMNSILKKMKALAIHSNNTGVTSPEQIAADQAEMDSAIQTLDRIAQTTKFSDENLLNGSKDIAYQTTTATKGTQQNALLNGRETSFSQIFKRDDYAVAISFTGTTNADELTGTGDVDFTRQAMKAYMEVDTSNDQDNAAQVSEGRFTQDQAFTLTGTKGSRAFTFDQGETVATMVSQIKSAADSTGIDAALVFNSDQKIHMTTDGVATKVAAGSETYSDIEFTINGLKNSKAEDINFTLAADSELMDAMAAKNTKAVDFEIEANGDGTYTLSETKSGLTLADTWDGKATSLANAITTTANSEPTAADKNLMNALAGALSADSDIDVTNSTAFDTSYDSLTWTPDGGNSKQTVLDGIFKGPAGAKGGTVELDMAAVDWEDVYNALGDDAKVLFDNAIKAGGSGIEVKAALGGDQDAPKLTLTLQAVGGAAIASQVVDLSAIDGQMGDGTQTVSAAAGTIFAGAAITVNDIDKTGIGFNLAAAVKGGTKGGAIVLDGGYAGGKVTDKALKIDAAADIALNADGSTVVEATFTNLIDNSGPPGASMKLGFVGATADVAVGGALNGKDITFSLVMDAGQDAANGDPKMKLTATVDGATYTIADGLTTGSDLAAQVNANMLNGDEIAESAGVTGNSAVANALTGMTASKGSADSGIIAGGYVGSTLNAAGAVDAAGANMFVANFPPITTDSITVADGIYGAAGEGKIEIKFDNFDLAKAFGNNIDMDAIAAKLDTAGGLKFTAEIVPSNTDPKDWSLSINATDESGNTVLLGSITSAQVIAASTNLDADGQTVDAANDGWVNMASLSVGDGTDGLQYQDAANANAGFHIRITNVTKKAEIGYDGVSKFETPTTTNPYEGTLEGDLVASGTAAGADQTFVAQAANTAAQAGGKAARDIGTVAIFNNVAKVTGDAKVGATDGSIDKGVSGIDISAEGADSVQLGMNTDGQGRIYVKFLDDDSYELYKDASMSAESLVATGINGKEINEANNSGLTGFKLTLQGTELTKVKGVYFSLAGMEGRSTNADNKTDGISYTGSVVGKAGSSALFEDDKTLITGVELGKNTDENGKIYLKTTYDSATGTAKVSAYKDANMRAEDLVAESEAFQVNTVDADGKITAQQEAMTIVLNEKRNADNTAGTGLGIVLSTTSNQFDFAKDMPSITGQIEFKNLGARVFAQDYGSANFVKITQDKGSVFSFYGSAGQNTSKTMIDAGSDGTTVQIDGQDATLSINGAQVRTTGLELSMATQDIQANLVFNEGKVGSTTLAQVGYDAGSIFTKIGALNLSSAAKETEGKYENLSGTLANAGHVTNETVNDFQGGMQLQLGEGAGDQNRTVVAIKSMTSENLGRITKGGYWDGDAVYSDKTFTMKDVFGGGVASLKQEPTLAMAIIEQAINDVSELRAQIGAVQTNMLQTNSNNLAVTMENIQKTESGIRDADMADEMTEFTKNQVLQGAAMSMMSQANQSSQNVLQLLR